MTPRPREVARWLRRPLWGGAATVALTTILLALDWVGHRQEIALFRDAYRVPAVIERDWSGGRELPVAYEDPESGRYRRTVVFVWESGRMPDTQAKHVTLEVARSDPGEVVLAGDRFPGDANYPSYLAWAWIPFVFWLARLFTWSRARALVAEPSAAYRMTGIVSPPVWPLARRLLHLFPLDRDDGDPACTVPLVGTHHHVGRVDVEVKGSPQPLGRVVAREVGGEVLWPAGRALLRRRPLRPWQRWAAAATPPLRGGSGGDHPAIRWRGLLVRGDRLWYGKASPWLKLHALRFEPEALIVVHASGGETAFTWSTHQRNAGPFGSQSWMLGALPPDRKGNGSVWVGSGDGRCDAALRIGAGRGRRHLWEELPALSEYLAATPEAREGLADRGRLVRLVRELSRRTWVSPLPASAKLFSRSFAIFYDVAAEIDVRMRRFGGRPVCGEPVPRVEDVVEAVQMRLRPARTASRETIEREVRRHLATAPWPFGVLRRSGNGST